MSNEPLHLPDGDLSDATRAAHLGRAMALDLFHTATGEPYIVFRDGPAHVAHSLHSQYVLNLFMRMFYRRWKRLPSSAAIAEAIRMLMAIALFEGPERKLHIRVAGSDGAQYLNLGNGGVIRITAQGWAPVSADEVPVKFAEPPGHLALPMPERGGSLNELAMFCNIADDDNLLLASAGLCSYARPSGPYVITVFLGPQGAGKSEAVRRLKSVVDPGAAVLRTLPNSIRDLMIAAANGHILAIDNVSRVTDRMSDAFCCISTGASVTERLLYSNGQEVINTLQRPIVLNGIGNFIERGDLLDRSIIIELPSIKGAQRMRVEVLEEEFKRAHPRLLGAVLDANVEALAKASAFEFTANLRMLDFAACGAAVAGTLSRSPADFEAAYLRNRNAGNVVAIEGSPIGVAILKLLESTHEWKGEPSQLLAELQSSNRFVRDFRFPQTAAALGSEMMRIAPALASQGIDVIRTREGKAGRRNFILRARRSDAVIVSPVSRTTAGAIDSVADEADGADEAYGGAGAIANTLRPTTETSQFAWLEQRRAAACGAVKTVAGTTLTCGLPAAHEGDHGQLSEATGLPYAHWPADLPVSGVSNVGTAGVDSDAGSADDLAVPAAIPTADSESGEAQ
jgi:hypothetical protein